MEQLLQAHPAQQSKQQAHRVRKQAPWGEVAICKRERVCHRNRLNKRSWHQLTVFAACDILLQEARLLEQLAIAFSSAYDFSTTATFPDQDTAQAFEHACHAVVSSGQCS
jgi:hypothetical protein